MGWVFTKIKSIQEWWYRRHQKTYYSVRENCCLSFLVATCVIICMVLVDNLDTPSDIFKCVFDTFVPTAATCAIGIVFHNSYTMYKENIFLHDENAAVLLLIVFCSLVYLGYRINYHSWLLVVTLIIVIIISLFVPIIMLCVSITTEIELRHSAVGNRDLYKG